MWLLQAGDLSRVGCGVQPKKPGNRLTLQESAGCKRPGEDFHTQPSDVREVSGIRTIVKAKCSHLPEPLVPEATGEQPSHASHTGGACSEPVPPTWSLLAGWGKEVGCCGNRGTASRTSICASRLGRSLSSVTPRSPAFCTADLPDWGGRKARDGL